MIKNAVLFAMFTAVSFSLFSQTHWDRLNSPDTDLLGILQIDDSTFVTHSSSEVFCSSDKGKTWNLIFTLEDNRHPIFSMDYNPVKQHLIFTDEGGVRSTKDFLTFEKYLPELNGEYGIMVLANGDFLTNGSHGLKHWNFSNQSWNQLSNVISNTSDKFSTYGDFVYASTIFDGLQIAHKDSLVFRKISILPDEYSPILTEQNFGNFKNAAAYNYIQNTGSFYKLFIFDYDGKNVDQIDSAKGFVRSLLIDSNNDLYTVFDTTIQIRNLVSGQIHYLTRQGAEFESSHQLFKTVSNDFWLTTNRGIYQLTGLKPVSVQSADIAESPNLLNIYPNPFNPVTVISYHLQVQSDVRLVVFDLLGREVTTLVNERKEAGNYTAVFDGKTVTSGIYFCRLTTGKYTKTLKMMLIK